MDPQLWEEIARGDARQEIRALMRLFPGMPEPANVRIVSRFGEIVTCRLRRQDIIQVRNDPAVHSLKAARGLEPSQQRRVMPSVVPRGQNRRPNVRETGKGVIVGVVDYGCDFAHHSFRNADGTSRIKAFWHQAHHRDTSRMPEPFNQGRVWTRDELSRALRKHNPYRALGYHPSRRGGDRRRQPSHGTHVLGIAAGNSRGDGPSGVAPDADIVFVHVDSGDTSGLLNFGDSVGVLEAVDFIARVAGNHPAVINISMGRHGGPHDGSTLIEQAIDHLLRTRTGLSIVQSGGNYYGQRIHCSGRLQPDEPVRLGWRVHPGARGVKELEIWLNQQDLIYIEITGPGGTSWQVAPGSRVDLLDDGVLVGRAYHRLGDPGNGDTHVDVFIYDTPYSAGKWQARLLPHRIRNGAWHAWLERHGSRVTQTRFTAGPVSNAVTSGTIATGRGAIQVAAHQRNPPFPIARFSSAGPTRDGRAVPMISAPGDGIWSARSAIGNDTHREITRKSGTSMASPYVAGVVALMLQASPSLDQRKIRKILRATARPIPVAPQEEGIRCVWGRIDPDAAIRTARRLGPQSNESLQPAEDTHGTEQVASSITPPEWQVIETWVRARMVPLNGGGAFAPRSTPANAAQIPAHPVDASRTTARALLNLRARRAGALGAVRPLPQKSVLRDPVLDSLAIELISAMPLGTMEWRAVGAFIEAQTDAGRAGSGAPSLFGTDDARNRLNIAHMIACQRLTGFPGFVGPAPACAFPQGGPADPGVAITMRALRRLGRLVDWPRVAMDERRLFIMEQLVNVHRYRPGPAAGIVGNLEAESGLIPERVEGSAHGTPRRALAWTGRTRHFSAASIRNRSFSRHTGPRRPGVGLAQWTTAARRARFFGHMSQGVNLREYILFFMVPQIEFLVSELRNQYRTLDRLLRRAGTTLEQASDAFVYDFERPGRIMEPRPGTPGRLRRRPRNDAQVQQVFQARRANARRAMAAYRAAHPAPTEQTYEPMEPAGA